MGRTPGGQSMTTHVPLRSCADISSANAIAHWGASGDAMASRQVLGSLALRRDERDLDPASILVILVIGVEWIRRWLAVASDAHETAWRDLHDRLTPMAARRRRATR